MARRSSARLRNRNSSTPKRVSLSHDVAVRTPRTAPVKLAALQENDEMPGAFPDSVSPPPRFVTQSAKQQAATVPVHFGPATPKDVTPIRPTDEEMHPKQHQHSTARPLEEARWLGFSNMAPYTEPPKKASKIAALQQTPTRAPTGHNGANSSKLQFTFRREQSLELSPDAKKLMDEKREEATKIREKMTAAGHGSVDVFEAIGRKIATPKSKKGRFSDAHIEQFKKMDSIASHASSFRGDPNRSIKVNTPSQAGTSAKKNGQIMNTPSKTLKRKQSHANLDEPDHSQLQVTPGAAKPTITLSVSHLPRSASSKNLQAQMHTESSSPVKRMKRNATEDVSKTRPASSDEKATLPSTPQQKPSPYAQALYPDLSTLASPTQASLARESSIKSSKIPAPALSRSPSKATLQKTKDEISKPSTPLLARSPSKASLFTNPDVEKPKTMMSPMLMRSPSKLSAFDKSSHVDDKEEPQIKQAPLLARSPLKMSVAKNAESGAVEVSGISSTPLLARSPARITLPSDNYNGDSVQPSSKLPGTGLMGRFNLLRSSPMKSILRSPQRLYSNDPAKVAAGTHLATPPKLVSNHDKVPQQSALDAATASAQKHVDFSNSTKARHERAQSELSSTPSKESTSSPKSETSRKPSPKPSFVQYPDIASEKAGPVISPNKRRQTAALGDFTFRAGEHSVIFGQSPNAPTTPTISPRPSTIRHVSAEPLLPRAPSPANSSKKRKFEFENDNAANEEISGAASDKENSGEERPAKRAKTSAPSPAPVKPAPRPPTLGVKPKKNGNEGKDKKSATISRARLNALAQPKRRD